MAGYQYAHSFPLLNVQTLFSIAPCSVHGVLI